MGGRGNLLSLRNCIAAAGQKLTVLYEKSRSCSVSPPGPSEEMRYHWGGREGWDISTSQKYALGETKREMEEWAEPSWG